MPKNVLARPFKAIRPTRESAQSVIAPPYDVVSRKEAKHLVLNKPHSFLRISRAEIEFPDKITDVYSREIYDRANANIIKLLSNRILLREETACFYIYKISSGKKSQTGIALSASINAYLDNRIKKHELTRTIKENDRINQIVATKAQTGPVMLAHKHCPAIKQFVHELTSDNNSDFSGLLDGWKHEIWILSDTDSVNYTNQLVNSLEGFYIADGHHRSAAAAAVKERNLLGTSSDGNGFLAVAFDEKELEILDYNRVLKTLNSRDHETFFKKIEKSFHIIEKKEAVYPGDPTSFGLYIDRKWYLLELKNFTPDPLTINNLSVKILEEHFLKPIIEIHNSREDDRIDFIGGSRGAEGVVTRVDSGDMQAGIMVPPTKIEQLFDVADNNQIMPPKSTWFEPKLADGLLSLSYGK